MAGLLTLPITFVFSGNASQVVVSGSSNPAIVNRVLSAYQHTHELDLTPDALVTWATPSGAGVEPVINNYYLLLTSNSTAALDTLLGHTVGCGIQGYLEFEDADTA